MERAGRHSTIALIYVVEADDPYMTVLVRYQEVYTYNEPYHEVIPYHYLEKEYMK